MREFDSELAAKQDEAVQYMLREECDGAALLAYDMGLGKTRTALMFAREYGAQCLLVSAPNVDVIENWKKAAGQEYPDLPVSVISSTKAGKTAMNNFTWRVDGIYLITHALWERRAWVKEKIAKRKKDEEQKYRKVNSGVWGGPGYMFVLDESHRALGEWTQRALLNIDARVFKVGLSGTPFGDSFDGAYPATKWLWPHRTDILPNNIFDWRAMWAEVVYDHYAPRNQKVTGEKNPGAFVSALPCWIREESNRPDAIEHEIWVDLYPEQRRIYDELDKRMVAWINDNPLVAEYSITKRARQRQVTLAVPTLEFDEDTDELLSVDFEDDAESVKTDRLFNAIDGEIPEVTEYMVDQQLLILTDSQRYARILTARLNDRYGDVAREWSGQVAQTKGKQKRTADRPYRAGIKQDFIDGKIKYIVGIYAAMGTGTDELQYTDARTVVGMSLPDYRITKSQGVARLNRTGQNQEVHFVMFLASNTVDTGQVSKQMDDAIKMSKSMRRAERKRKLEEQRERLRDAIAQSQHSA